MSQLITLKKNDAQFLQYLRGTFADDKRALPVQSLNVDSENEQIVFRVVDQKEIVQPSFLKKWAAVLRLRSIPMVGIPLLWILVKNLLDETAANSWIGVSAGLGIVSCFVGVNLLQDYIDHMKGLDRVLSNAGHQAIQKGWVAAWTVQWWAWGYLVLGLLLGLPALITRDPLIWVAAIAVSGGLGLVKAKKGLKLTRWSEFFAFFLLGPLLTLGFQLALGGSFDLEVIYIGVLAGWFAAFQLHIKNFCYYFENTQISYQSSISSLGFDTAKVFLLIWWMVFCAMLLAYYYMFSNTLWLATALILLALLNVMLLKNFKQLKSPVGSSVNQLKVSSQVLVFAVYSFWFVSSLWHLSFLL